MRRNLASKILVLSIALLFLLTGCALKSIPDNLFSEGLLAIEKDGRYGYLDTKGNKVIDFYFDEAYAFNGKYAIIVRNNGYNIIDKSGITQFDDDLDYLYFDYETGYLWYVKDELLGLMKTNGDIVVEAKYELTVEDDYSSSLESFSYFQEGLARVVKNGKFGYIDKTGEIIIDFDYEDAGHFSQGLAYYANSEGKYGYINKKGEIIISPKYDYAEEFNLNKQAIVADITTEYDYIYALINKDGEEIIGSLSDIEDHNDIYIVIKDEKCYLINTKGKMISEDIFNDFAEMGEFILLAVLNDDYDATAITIFKLNGDVYYELTENEVSGEELADFFAIDDKLYLLFKPKSGSTITLKLKKDTWTFEADSVNDIHGKYVITERNDEYGVRTFKDAMVIDYLYDYIWAYDDGYFLARLDGKIGILNERGKTIAEFLYTSCNTDINSYNK
ncbi:MAG: hypothetical protein CVV56_01585 [Tenericutes bacterium HGW-Tenericutes-1]|jgi:hypothetical protein|nr:MAG: hypothetical protein CVV56_01585 [Tenericutes bacterium HGW-Tenericutes-1]